MQRVSFIILFLLFTFIAFGQATDSTTNQQERALLLRKWALVYIQGKVDREYSSKEKGHHLTFNSDGTYAAYSKKTGAVSGSWWYDEKLRTLLMAEKQKAS